MRILSLAFSVLLSVFLLTGCNEGTINNNDWVLDQDYSTFTITSIKKSKKSSVGEAFHFKAIKGSINAAGRTKIAINLASIESEIPVRDDRLKKILFQIVLFPTADVTADLDLKDFLTLNVGHRTQKEITFKLSLHGMEEEIETDVFITRISQNSYSVATIKPIMISAKTFKLDAALKKLAKIAKLPTISDVVPTSFNFLFRRKL